MQILFAFLLTWPMRSRFDTLDRWDRGVFLAALLLSATASVCLIAPVAYHRMLFREHMKDWIVRSADHAAQAGLILLALAMVTALTLVLDLVILRPAAIGVAAGMAAGIAVMWFVVPLIRRRRSGVPS